MKTKSQLKPLRLRSPLSKGKRVAVAVGTVVGATLTWTGWTGPELLDRIASGPWLDFFGADWFQTVLLVAGLGTILVMLLLWFRATPATLDTVTVEVPSFSRRDLILEHRNNFKGAADLVRRRTKEGMLWKDMADIVTDLTNAQKNMLSAFQGAGIGGLGTQLTEVITHESLKGQQYVAVETRLDSMVEALDQLVANSGGD